MRSAENLRTDKLSSTDIDLGDPAKRLLRCGYALEGSLGAKAIESYRSYEEFGDDCDRIVSRSEHDPDGPLSQRRVLRLFVRQGSVFEVRIGGRTVGTTGEHPFYARGRGWVAAAELRPGEGVALMSGGWGIVEGVAETGRLEALYNLEVEDDHTYFVGCSQWGFSVWAHNTYKDESQSGGLSPEAKQLEVVELLNQKGLSFEEAWRVAEAGGNLTPNEAKQASGGKLTHHDGDVLLEMARTLSISDPLSSVGMAPKPNWAQPSLSSTTGANSKTLRRALGLADGDGRVAAHHLVESTGKAHGETRQLLTEFQIDINSSANGIALSHNGSRGPEGFIHGTSEAIAAVPRSHRGTGLHTETGELAGLVQSRDRLRAAVDAAAAGGMKWGGQRAALLNEMNMIKLETIGGHFPGNIPS